MNKLLITTIAVAALSACGQSDRTEASDVNAAEANTAAIVLPPAIVASKIYRCKDNDVVYVDWLSDNVSANFRAAQGETPTQLKAAAAGEPLVAEGYSLTGDATAATVTLTRPGKGSQACKA